MKTNQLKIPIVIFLTFILAAGCDLIQIPGLFEKTLTADEAKVEIRSANQEIVSTKDDMLSTTGMDALNYLLNLMNGETPKSAIFNGPVYASRLSYTKVLNYFRKSSKLKSASLEDDSNYGILEYNYDSGSFDLVEESSTILQIRYPANDVAFTNQVNNAVLTVSNLVFDEITSTEEYYDYNTDSYVTSETSEEIPVSASVSLEVDGSEELTADYSAAYTSDGLPTSMDMSMESGDYSLSLSFSGAGVDYSSKLMYKLKNDVVMAYNYDIRYTSDKTNVEMLSGYFQITPLKFQGTINSADLQAYMEEADVVDLVYLNSLMDMQVYQSESNAKIGDLEYQMYYDAEWDEEYPEIAIVYEDGTSEWLTDVLTFAEMDL